MPRDPSQHSRSQLPAPAQGDRRKANALKGVPLIGGLGLVVIDRRSYRERRGKRRSPPRAALCALLQRREERPARGLFQEIRSGWGQTAIGAWIRHRLKYPWRIKARPPEGPP